MDNIMKNKKGLDLVTNPSSGYKASSKKFLLLVFGYLTKSDDAVFQLFQKLYLLIHASRFMAS